MSALLKSTEIQCFSGSNASEAPLISIRYGSARIILDFGVKDAQASYLPNELPVRLRSTALLRDYLQLGVLPAVDGLFTSKSLTFLPSITPVEKSTLQTIVMISHIDPRRIQALGLIAQQVPVYMTEESHRLLAALSALEGTESRRTYAVCRYHEVIQLGDITVTVLPVDHAAPGAAAFHVRTPDGSMLYTGDLRYHGKRPERTARCLQLAKQLGTDVLLLSGRSITSLPAAPLASHLQLPVTALREDQIASKTASLLKQTDKLAFFNVEARQVDRAMAMIEAARQAGRMAVLEPETAYVIYRMTKERSFLIFESEHTMTMWEQRMFPRWKRELSEHFSFIPARQLSRYPHAYFLQNSVEHTLELLDLPLQGSLYLHSDGAPADAADPAYGKLLEFVQTRGARFETISSTPYALPEHLQFTVDELQPKYLMTLSTKHSQALAVPNGQALTPAADTVFTLRDGCIDEYASAYNLAQQSLG